MHKPPRNNIKIKYTNATSKGNWFRLKSDAANSAPSVYAGYRYIYFKQARTEGGVLADQLPLASKK